MKISYDPEVDALSIIFRETTVTTKHLAEGIAADYDSEGRLAGLGNLDAQKRFGGREKMRPVGLERVGRLAGGGPFYLNRPRKKGGFWNYAPALLPLEISFPYPTA